MGVNFLLRTRIYGRVSISLPFEHGSRKVASYPGPRAWPGYEATRKVQCKLRIERINRIIIFVVNSDILLVLYSLATIYTTLKNAFEVLGSPV